MAGRPSRPAGRSLIVQGRASGAKKSFLLGHLALPLLLAAVAVPVFEASDLDLRAAGLFWNPQTGRWLGEDAFWANELLHDAGKWAVVAWAVSALALFLISFFVPRLRSWRWAALYLVLCTGLGTGLVGILKATTGRHCPREMTPFGGSVPYTKLFEGPPPGFPAGRCFPSGHAAGPLSLVGIYFVARARGLRRPVLGLLPAAALGGLYAFGQDARGAHFPSHDFWAALLCWLVALALALAFRERCLAGGDR